MFFSVQAGLPVIVSAIKVCLLIYLFIYLFKPSPCCKPSISNIAVIISVTLGAQTRSIINPCVPIK